MCQLEKNKILKKLGENIKHLRIEQNISQEELAFRVNSARNFVGCIERAEKNSSIITLARISKALNISLCELLKDIDT